MSEERPNEKPRLFQVCCEDLSNALRWGLCELDGVYGEINLGYHQLDQRWQTGNVLTGETYDPKTFSMSMSLSYCPFCGLYIGSTPGRLPVLVPLTRQLDSLLGAEIPFNLHKHIRAVMTELDKMSIGVEEE